jgi:hypothetical protein
MRRAGCGRFVADRSLTLSGATPLPKETRGVPLPLGEGTLPILEAMPRRIRFHSEYLPLGGGGISYRYATGEGAKKIL